MGLFSRKAKQIEKSQAVDSIGKMTSDKAVDLIKQLRGDANTKKTSLVDNYIVITNCSGGTGASTIASNVAYIAAAKGLKVIVLDLNILCPTQHTFLNIKQAVDEKADLVSYLLGKTKLADSIDTSHIYSLMFANNRNIADLINCNADTSIVNYTDLISKLRRLFDLIIVDCPMNIDNMLCNTALYGCDTIYSVWDEGISSISNTDRLRRNMSYCGIDSYTKMKIILNKRTNIRYNMYPFKKLNVELVHVLPFDTSVIETSVRGQIFCEKGASNSKNALAFEKGINDLTDKMLKIGGMIQ